MAIERACFGRDAWDEALFSKYLAAWPELFLIGKQAGQSVAYSIASVRGVRAEIESIAVEPRSKRQGIGSALLRRTLTKLKRREVSSVGLMVETRNKPAIALYEHFGFHCTRIIRDYYGAGRHGWRLHLNLDRS